MTLKNEGGFSLLELMVTIAIISALTSLAIPKYSKYKVSAAHAEVKSMLASVHTANELNLFEKNEYESDIKGKLGIPISANSLYTYGSDSNASDNLAKVTGAVVYELVAKSKQKLASCSGSNEDIWCLNHNKLMTNKMAERVAPAAVANGCIAIVLKDGSC